MSIAHSWTRVIVLTPLPHGSGQGGGMDEDLRSQFTSRDWYAIEQHNPHEAMVELCLRERTQCSRAAWGLHRIEQIALVVHRPEHWNAADLRDLIAAVRHYLPAATIWHSDHHGLHAVYQPEPKTTRPARPTTTTSAVHLAGFETRSDDSDLRVHPESCAEHEQQPQPLPPALRFESHRPHTVSGHELRSNGDVAEYPSGSSISRQEIAMLLDDDDAISSTIRGAMP